jgi:hypothetical protein
VAEDRPRGGGNEEQRGCGKSSHEPRQPGSRSAPGNADGAAEAAPSG